MGDIGGGLQAGAQVVDTAATDATNIYMQQQGNQFNAQQAALQRAWSGDQAQNQMAFNAQQAAQNRSFQASQQLQAEDYNTQMANTAVQRRMADLSAAGVNPLLAASQLGGASTPIMSAPSGSTASAGIPGGASASTAGLPRIEPIMQGLANLKLTNAQVSQTTQAARKTGEEADILSVQDTPDKLMLLGQQMEAQYSIAHEQAGVLAQTKNLLLEQTLTNAQQRSNLRTDQAWQIIQNNIASMDNLTRSALLDQAIKVQSAILTQQGQEATNIASVQNAKDLHGVLAKTIAVLQATSTSIGSAAGAAGVAGAGAAAVGAGATKALGSLKYLIPPT